MSNVFVEYWDVFVFYGLVVILLYLFRSRFEFQGIVALLKTKLGLKFMTKTGERWPRFWHHVGLLSIILGFAGMLFITVYLFVGLYNLFLVPNAPPALSPVIPGVKIPGVPITFPLWYTLIALFFSVIVHEGFHGIFSAAYKIKIKSSGFAFFGPLPGAFVEPDEKILEKRSKREQLAIFSAGPFSNVILAIIALVLVTGLFGAASTFVDNTGTRIQEVQNGTGAWQAGIPSGVVITAVDGTPTLTTKDFSATLASHKPGEAIVVTANNTNYTVTLGASPDNNDKAYLGVLGVTTESALKEGKSNFWYTFLLIVGEVFMWTYIISLGLGIANLLPIGPVDGGRMFLIALMSVYPEQKAKAVWGRWSLVMFILILVLVFVPIIKAVIF